MFLRRQMLRVCKICICPEREIWIVGHQPLASLYLPAKNVRISLVRASLSR